MRSRRVPCWVARRLSHFLWRAKVAADLVVEVLGKKLAIFGRLVILVVTKTYVLYSVQGSKALAAMWARVLKTTSCRGEVTADVESCMLRRVSTNFREYTSVTYVVARRSVNKCPEALHALELALTWVRHGGRWLTRVDVRAIRGRTRTRTRTWVRLLRDDALVLVILDDVAWLVPKALSFS